MEQMIKELLQKNSEHGEVLKTLIESSEKRIDRCNEMVSKLAEAAKSATETTQLLTLEYTKRIEQLANSRDALLEQNKILLSLVDRFGGGKITIENK